MDNTTIMVVKTALREMFVNRNSFSICTIDECLKLTNTIPDSKTYQLMRALHCIDYKNMEPELRQWLFRTVLMMFNENGFELSELDLVGENKKLLPTFVHDKKILGWLR